MRYGNGITAITISHDGEENGLNFLRSFIIIWIPFQIFHFVSIKEAPKLTLYDPHAFFIYYYVSLQL